MKHLTRSIEVKAVEDGGRFFTARAVTYNTVDWYETQFAPGSFTKSLEKKFPVLAWGHDWTEPIGKIVDVSDGPDGLDVRCRLSDPDAVPRAKQAIAQLRDGDITDVSVGFGVISEERRDNIQTFTEVDWDELSLVLAGAVPGAKVLALRSRNKQRSPLYVTQDAATQIISAYEQARADGVPTSDALMAALSDLKSQSFDSAHLPNGGEVEQTPEPEKPAEAPTTPQEVPGAEPEVGDPKEEVHTPEQVDTSTVADELDALLNEADTVLDGLTI